MDGKNKHEYGAYGMSYRREFSSDFLIVSPYIPFSYWRDSVRVSVCHTFSEDRIKFGTNRPWEKGTSTLSENGAGSKKNRINGKRIILTYNITKQRPYKII